MLLINLDHQSKVPLFRQIVVQLKGMIETNVLKPGFQLPSTRSFSDKHGIHRTTVCKAYEELWALGYVESRPGSYSTVRKRAEIASEIEKEKEKIIQWEEISNPNADLLIKASKRHPIGKSDEDKTNFIYLTPDPNLMPVSDFKKSLNHTINHYGAAAFEYADPQGDRSLREFIAQQMCLHSMTVSPEEIIITNGAQNGIDLLLHLIASGKKKKIIVESPTYWAVISQFRYYNAEIIAIPMKEDGMDLNLLRKEIEKDPPVMIYTIPNFHNPTGITTSQAHREELLSICEFYGIPIVEDGFEEEMKYFGKTVLPIKSMDKNNIVCYLGTFSKIIFPGLRLGWIAADKECIERLSAIRRSVEISGNTLTQLAMTHFCQSGSYELHIKRIHRVYRKRMHVALKAAKEYFPEHNFSFTKPLGGYTLWVDILNPDIPEELVLQRITNHGVLVSPGKEYFPENINRKGFRISISQHDETAIEQGFIKIGEALKTF